MTGGAQERGGLGQAFGRLTEGLQRLISDHLALARVELRQDARSLGVQAAKIAVFLPAVLVGYGLLCVALALALAPWLGSAGAFAVVGGLNLVAGGLGAYLALRRMGERPVLESTRVEVERTGAALGHVTHPDGAERRLGA